jgi:MOSC domain-containing protein YiiM
MRYLTLVSVNVGKVQPIRNAKPSGKTGIYKLATSDPVEVTPLGLRGDAIVDTENHGGLDQAVSVFTIPDYTWWASHIGMPLQPGMFGENLTLSDLQSAELNIGDRFRVGQVLLQVTSPRVPCVTIAARMNDPHFVRKFRNAERPGAYCRVIETGLVRAGDPVEWIPFPASAKTSVSLLESFRAFYRHQFTVDEIQRFLSVPLHHKDRENYEGVLRQLKDNQQIRRC